MSDHVLVPIDESECSTAALDHALETKTDAQITVLHVTDPVDIHRTTGIESGTLADYERIRKDFEQRSENILETARRRADDADVRITTDHLVGDVPKTIVEYVSDHDVDHVIMGSHGRTGASRVLLGSVAETVVRRSPVPVTVVR